MRGKAAIIGVGEAGLGPASGRTHLQLQAEAALAALSDAGLTTRDVDGVLVGRSGNLYGGDMPSAEIAEYLGIEARFSDSTLLGGASALVHVEHAAMAIAAGLCRTCLIVYGSAQASRRVRRKGGYAVDPDTPEAQYERPYGNLVPIGNAALLAARHMYQYGTRPEHLASVAVSARRWAALTPGAMRPQPLTVEAVLASPMVADPLHALDCCLISDGAGALVMTAAPAPAGSRPVLLMGAATCHSHHIFSQSRSLTETPARTSGAAAMRVAGVAPADIDLIQLYDAFTILPVLLVEDLGFCPKGRGGFWMAEGHTQPGGDLPMNTQGGGLAYAHPGMFGTFLLIEAVRQLRGEAGMRQVANAELCLCHGVGGGGIAAHATVILGR